MQHGAKKRPGTLAAGICENLLRIPVLHDTAAFHEKDAIGDFALALRELRTYRRISGKDDQIALMFDSERGVGRPERALELGRSVERADLPVEVRVELDPKDYAALTREMVRFWNEQGEAASKPPVPLKEDEA